MRDFILIILFLILLVLFPSYSNPSENPLISQEIFTVIDSKNTTQGYMSLIKDSSGNKFVVPIRLTIGEIIVYHYEKNTTNDPQIFFYNYRRNNHF